MSTLKNASTEKATKAYREAARRIEAATPGEENASCLEIEYVLGRVGADDWHEITQRYKATMLPDGVKCHWCVHIDTELDPQECHAVRALMLCFMAAMVEAGDA